MSARLFAGVPQGAILSPLLFSVYMNDIPIPRTTNLFADDTSSYIVDSVPSFLESKLQERTDLLSEWFFKWRLTVNPTKCAVMVFRSKKMQPVSIQITIDTHHVPQVSDHRHLGVTFLETPSWTFHTDNIVHAASTKTGLLRRLRKHLSPLIIRQLYLTCIRPSLEYANVAWCGLTKCDQERLEKSNHSAARLITRTMPSFKIPHDILLARAGIPTLLSRRQVAPAQVKLAFTATRGLLPAHLQATFSSWTVPSSFHVMAQRNPCTRLPRPGKDIERKSPFYSTFSLWNSLPAELQRSTNTNSLLLFFTCFTVWPWPVKGAVKKIAPTATKKERGEEAPIHRTVRGLPQRWRHQSLICACESSWHFGARWEGGGKGFAPKDKHLLLSNCSWQAHFEIALALIARRHQALRHRAATISPEVDEILVLNPFLLGRPSAVFHRVLNIRLRLWTSETSCAQLSSSLKAMQLLLQ